MSALEQIKQITAEAEQAIESASDKAALEDLRIHYLGRKAQLPQLLRTIAELDPAERASVGAAGNQARKHIEAALISRESSLAEGESRLLWT